MNIENGMRYFKGPKSVILPEEGTRFTFGDQHVNAQLKLGPGDYPHYKFTAVRFDIEPGQKLEFMASMYHARMIYCLEGIGVISLNGEKHPIYEEVFVHVGEGHHAYLHNNGDVVLQIFSFVFGSSPEARLDLAEPVEGALHISLTAQRIASFGLMTAQEAAKIDMSVKGVLVYQLPDSGPSFWQAKPSAGWVEVKLSPFTHDIHHYALLMQTLYPSNAVREHAHNQLNEFFIITKGTARAALDGKEAICPKGSVIIIGRNVWHWWGNAGEGNAQNFAIIDPPGVEGALALTGRARGKDEVWPDDIVRNSDTGKILQERYGFLIREGSEDAVS